MEYENIGLEDIAVEEIQENNNDNQEVDVVVVEQEIVTVEIPDTPKSVKKRKRNSVSKVSPLRKLPEFLEEDDDGSLCPICLDYWDITGLHRLTSLKCGHLFGHSCIKRWLQENQSQNKSCPSCKMKATMKDFRFLYAKKISAIDNSEETRLHEELEKERAKSSKIQMDFAVTKLSLELQMKITEELESRINKMSNDLYTANKSYISYKLFMEKNIEISKEPGCRVMLYSCKNNTILVSLKPNQTIFSGGYGIRFIDTPTFRSTQFLFVSPKTVRDLSFDQSDDLLITASMENHGKLFNVHNRTIVNQFAPSEYSLWSCSFDKSINRANSLYLGSQNGSTFLYDIRNANSYIDELRTEGDLSPVINICSIPSSQINNNLPNGGIVVCKLKSLWFFEYNDSQNITQNLLNIDGPFLGINYNDRTGYLLISTRPSIKYPTIRYIIANLCKVNNVTVLNVLTTFNGSKSISVMTRCTQINTNDNTIVAGYLEDSQLLTTWGINKNNEHYNSTTRMQSIHCNEIIYDMCPIQFDQSIYLGAITDKKCRLYKLNADH